MSGLPPHDGLLSLVTFQELYHADGQLVAVVEAVSAALRGSSESVMPAYFTTHPTQRRPVQLAFLFAYEYLSGSDLYVWATSRPERTTDFRTNELEVKPIFAQLAGALLYLHQRGVAHLDIKPENAMFATADAHIVKLIDMGIAERTTPGAASCPVQGARGSAPYQAPEQHSGAPFDGFCADIFAMGVTLLVLMTGHFPWLTTEATDRRFRRFCKQHGGSVASLTAGWDQLAIPPHTPLASILDAMLSPDPPRRPTVYQLILHPWIAAVMAPELVAAANLAVATATFAASADDDDMSLDKDMSDGEETIMYRRVAGGPSTGCGAVINDHEDESDDDDDELLAPLHPLRVAALGPREDPE